MEKVGGGGAGGNSVCEHEKLRRAIDPLPGPGPPAQATRRHTASTRRLRG